MAGMAGMGSWTIGSLSIGTPQHGKRFLSILSQFVSFVFGNHFIIFHFCSIFSILVLL